MSKLTDIQAKFAAGEFRLSRNAFVRMLQRHISVDDIDTAVATGDLIEDYPNDKYGLSCRILGFSPATRPIHVQCSHAVEPPVKVITS